NGKTSMFGCPSPTGAIKFQVRNRPDFLGGIYSRTKETDTECLLGTTDGFLERNAAGSPGLPFGISGKPGKGGQVQALLVEQYQCAAHSARGQQNGPGKV